LSNDELTEPVSLLLLLLLLRHAATLRHADSRQQSQSITSIAFLLPFFFRSMLYRRHVSCDVASTGDQTATPSERQSVKGK